MVKLSVCIEMLWADLLYERRITRVGELGFGAFEFWRWSDKNLAAIRAAQERSGMAVAAMSLEPGWNLVAPRALGEIRRGLGESIAAAACLGCRTLIATVGRAPEGEPRHLTRRRLVRHLRAMAPTAEEGGVTLVLEPLNTRVDHPGYWLTRMSEAHDIVQEVASPAVRLLMDIYHQQVTEGNIIANLTAFGSQIAHVHAAGVPGRHELADGELDYRRIFAALEKTGYTGYVGLEYRPLLVDDVSLRQALALAESGARLGIEPVSGERG